jgi:uncharacterized paraquat-inducible protein A
MNQEKICPRCGLAFTDYRIDSQGNGRCPRCGKKMMEAVKRDRYAAIRV